VKSRLRITFIFNLCSEYFSVHAISLLLVRMATTGCTGVGLQSSVSGLRNWRSACSLVAAENSSAGGFVATFYQIETSLGLASDIGNWLV
jgi:hypothetical protein